MKKVYKICGFKDIIMGWLYENYDGIIQTKDNIYNHYNDIKTPSLKKDGEKAKEYADKLVDLQSNFSTSSTDGTNDEEVTQHIEVKGEYTFIGPYNLTMNGGTLKGTATIESKNSDGGVKNINTSLCSTDGKTVKELKSLSSYDGDDFYIVYKGTLENSVEKITLEKENRVIRSRIALAEPRAVNGQNVGVYYGEEATETEKLNLPRVPESKITIIKKDISTGKTLEGIGLVLYSEEAKAYVKVKNDQKVEYVTNIKDATEFKTDAKGEVVVEKLTKKGKYIVYETKHPDAEANGYEEVSKEKPLKVAEGTIQAIGTNIEITAYNKREYIKISGFVWEDMQIYDGKENAKNLIYKDTANKNDVNDKLLENVTVKLMSTKTGEIAAKTTNSEGAYQFTKVKIDQLNEYYIQFTYNGLNYQCVDLIDLNQWNTSKAKEEGTKTKARTQFNNKFAEITYNKANEGKTDENNLVYDGIKNNVSTLNLEGRPVKGYADAKNPINGVADKYLITETNTYNAYDGCLDKIKTAEEIRKQEISELKNINLGLVEREQPDLSVTKDIYNVKIHVNGRNQIYNYNHRQALDAIEPADDPNNKDSFETRIGVKFGSRSKKMKYTRTIYKADALFESEDKSRELKVYLTYKIEIKNNSSNLYAQINQISDFYDKKYAEAGIGADITVGKTLNEGATVTDTINYQDLRNNYSIPTKSSSVANQVKEKYNKMIINTGEAFGKLNPQSKKTLYVQFKLSRQLVLEILDQDEDIRPLENVTEIASYSIFDEKQNTYAGIDQHSNPGNAIPGDISTYEADTAWAPSLKLEYNAERTITGNVFEDLPNADLLKNENIRQGNGKLDEGEPGIPKVKVELLRKEARKDGTYGDWTVKEEYTTTTDEKGLYTIKDFAAGDYVIRYTWGGKEHIVGVSKKYTAQNYKATVFDEAAHNEQSHKWYEKNVSDRLSDAKDVYDEVDKRLYTSEGISDTRETIDKDINTESIKYDKVYDETKVMVSQTNEMAIDIEYKTTDPIDEPEKDTEKTDFGTSKEHTIENIDFGIIERPRQYYELIKKIDTIKVTLQNGQVLVDAKIDDDYKVTPDGTTSLTSMRPVVGGTEGYPNGLVKLEMDNELIQGATVKLTYDLFVKNSSEIDYAYKAFYTYGKSGIPSSDEERKRTATRITIEKINDYLDKEWAVNENEETFVENGWEKKTINQLEGQVDPKVLQGTDEEKTSIKDRIILQSEKLKGNSIATGEKTDLLKLTATKVLTTINNSDIELDNEAEVTQVTKTGGGALTTKDGSKKIIPGNYVPGAGKKVEDDDDMAQTFTVTPNTGSNLNYVLPISIGVGALMILGVGIVWIKKRFEK